MRVFGFDLTVKRASALNPVYGGGDRGWMTWHSGGEPFMGGFQQDVHVGHDSVLANWTVFACMTLIAGDVGKMRIKLMEDDDGIWTETDSSAFSPVLRKPNTFQTRQKFIESWIFSKLSHGNTYVLKERDNRGVVVALYVLDPHCVKPLVTPTGLVYYELKEDYLSHLVEGESIVVPASEIIHDRMWCLYHPLVGLSPIFAAGLAASQGLKIQHNSARFFANQSRPGGILTAPGEIKDDLARAYQARWEESYGAGKAGRTAVLGGGMKYEAMTQSAHDSQLVEQLKMSAEMICSTFHVPAYKVGVGSRPAYQNAAMENQSYYDTCLQPLIEAVEANLDEGLGLGESPNKQLGTELDLDALLRMDQGAQTQVLKEQVGAGITSPNEARARLNMAPTKGGEAPMIQQQNYSLPALAKRDQGEDPFGTEKPPAPPVAPPAEPPTKGIETILVGVVDAQKQLELSLDARLDAIDRKFDAQPDAQVEGAKRLAQMLRRALEEEPACV